MRRNLIGAHVFSLPQKAEFIWSAFLLPMLSFLSVMPSQRADNNVDLAFFRGAFVWLMADPLEDPTRLIGSASDVAKRDRNN
jgi:hypothetical protein